MNKQVLKQLKSLQPGDLVKVSWLDASIGKSLVGGPIDVPVYSYGVYLGLLGKKSKHVILAQNTFRYSDKIFDIDYTAIPAGWGISVTVLKAGEVDPDTARALLSSFLQGRSRTLKRRKTNHARMD